MFLSKTSNNFLIIPKVILYHFLFIKHQWIFKISLVSVGLNSTEKKITIPLNHVLFSLTVKSFEIVPKHSAYSFFSGSFALNSYIFVALTNMKRLLPLQCRYNTKHLLGCVKLIGYIASAANVVSSNACVGPSPRIKISLFFVINMR